MGIEKYDKEYYQKYKQYAQTPLGHEINRVRWDLVLRDIKKDRTRLLDYGCGTGSFIDSNPSLIVSCRGYDVNPHNGYSVNGSILNEEWDIVTMWDVLEHMHWPGKFLARLNTGRLYILTPDVSSIKGPIENWKHYRPDEHQHYFTMASIDRLLERNGYLIEKVDRTESVLRAPEEPNNLMIVVAVRK